MSFEDLLTQMATVVRYTLGTADTYGNQTKTWYHYLSGQPCRLSSAGGKQITQGLQIVIANYKLFVFDIDVTEQDQIELDGVTYKILLVNTFRDFIPHHKELFLEAVR